MDTANARDYIVQQPNSVTNETGKYRVVSFTAWLNYLNQDRRVEPLAVLSEHDGAVEAAAARDAINAPACQS